MTESQRILDEIHLREDETAHIGIGHALTKILYLTLTTVDYVDILDDIHNSITKIHAATCYK